MGFLSRVVLAFFFVSMSATSFDSGGLEYQSENFSLTINSDGSGELAVLYKDFGSKEEKGSIRKKELSYLRDKVMSNGLVEEASAEGVEIMERRLDFENYSLGGFVRAKSAAYGRIFDVFTLYKLEIEDKIYITPLNGLVGQATLSPGGEIVIRNNKYAFAWPTDAKLLEFNAAYKVKGISFRAELGKR